MQAKKSVKYTNLLYIEIYVSFLTKRGYNIVNFVHYKGGLT